MIKELNIAPQEVDQLKIRGIVFDVLRTDHAVLEWVVKLEERGKKLSASDARGVYQYIQDIISYVDEVLGKGAMAKIAARDNARAVRLEYAVKVLSQISRAIFEMHREQTEEYVATEYEAPEDGGKVGEDADIPPV